MSEYAKLINNGGGQLLFPLKCWTIGSVGFCDSQKKQHSIYQIIDYIIFDYIIFMVNKW